MAGLDPAIQASPYHIIGIAGSSPAMTAVGVNVASRPIKSDPDTA
jgi:hypothetical protein